MSDKKNHKESKVPYYKTKEFIKLQNKWYDKLSKKGFHDLEWLDTLSGAGHSTPFLRKSLNKFKQLDNDTIKKSVEYYSAAQDFASHYEFPSKLHKRIWLLFADGISYRKMIPIIKSFGYKHIPSIFWISIHLNKMKKDFWIWQYDQTQDEDTWDSFIRDNNKIPD
jgi:hypothetical protein